MQVDEHPDLRPQHLGHDRLEQEVHRPDLVAPEHCHVGAFVGGQEDDRRVPRAVALPDQVGDLEAVHARHLDVHQDQREVVVEQPAQRLDAGARPDEVLAQLARASPRGRRGCSGVSSTSRILTLGSEAKFRSMSSRLHGALWQVHSARSTPFERVAMTRPPSRRPFVLRDGDRHATASERRAGLPSRPPCRANASSPSVIHELPVPREE